MQDRPAVILRNIGLPGMDDYEVSRRVRAIETTTPGPPILLVALTGFGQTDDIRRGGGAGFNHHLVKPTDLDAIEALLEPLAP